MLSLIVERLGCRRGGLLPAGVLVALVASLLVAAPSGAQVEPDPGGDSVPAAGEEATGGEAVDVAAPVLVSASVLSNYVSLFFGEALDGGSQPDAGDFSVSVTDAVTGVVSQPGVDAVSVAGNYVSLSLSGAARHGDVVSVSYVPGDDPVQDDAANPAAALGARLVVNDTQASNNSVLRGLELSGMELSGPAFERVSRWSVLLGYSASVPEAVSETTVIAAPADPRASVRVTTGDGAAVADGARIGLDVGLNTVTVTVTAEDGATTSTHTVEVTRAEAAPELVSATVRHGYVALGYGEALDGRSQPDPGDFSVSATDSVTGVVRKLGVDAVSASGVVVHLTLSGAVRHGDEVTVSYVPGADPIQGAAGNPAAALQDRPLVNDTAASNNPALSGLELSGVEGWSLSAPETIEMVSRWSVLNGYSASAPEAVSETTVTAVASDPRASVQVTTGDGAAVADGAPIGLDVGLNTVTVTVTAEDGATTSTHTFEVTRADETAPVLVSATVEGASLVLSYDEPLDEGSEPGVWDYSVAVTDSVTGGVQRELYGVDVVGATVVLTLLQRVRHGDTVTVSYESWPLDAVQDAAGNHAADFEDHLVVNPTAASDDALLDRIMVSDDVPLLDVARLVDVELSPVFDAATTDYTASVPHQAASVTVLALAADRRATVAITTGNDGAADDGTTDGSGQVVDLVVGPNTVTVTVTAEDGATTRTYTITVTRAAKPELESATVDGSSLVLGYDKDLDDASVPDGADFGVAVTDAITDEVSQPDVTAVSVAGATVTLTLSVAARSDDTVTVSYTPGTDPVRDAAGAGADALADAAVANTTGASHDTELSGLALSAADGSAVELSPVFDAATTDYTASVPHLVASVSVAATAADARAGVAAPDDDAAVEGGQVDLDVGPNTVTVTVTAEDGANTRTYTIEVTRAAKPQLDTATVDGTSLVLVYDKALDDASQPDGADFGVAVTDAVTGEESQPDVAALHVAGATVTLTLSVAARSDDTVTVSYTPGTDPVQDAAGAGADALADHAVTNATAESDDTELSGLVLSAADGSAVELSPVFDAATTDYTASVFEAVSAATVTAAAVDPRASVQVTAGDTEAVDGLVALSMESNTVTVTVTAEDGATTGTYTIEVTRVDQPTLVSATIFRNDVVLVYDEDLDDDGVRGGLGLSVRAAVDDFTVSAVYSLDGTVYSPTVTGVWVQGDVVYMYLEEAVYFADTVSIDYTPGADPQILGVDGVPAAGFSGYEVDNVTPARGDEGLRALELSDVELAPGFSRHRGSYTAWVGHSVSSTTVTAATVDPWGSVQVAPADSDSVAPGDQVALDEGPNTITVTVPGRGNYYRAVAYTVLVYRTENTDAPDLSGATILKDDVVLSYDETLDEDSRPAAGDFTVSVTDSVTGTTSAPAVTEVSIRGSAVKLKLSASARPGDAVRVSYTPGAAPVQDLADGYDARGFAGRSVANITGPSADATLSRLQLSDAGLDAGLVPGFAPDVRSYTASVANEVSSISVAAAASDPRASRPLIAPADDDANVFNGHRVPLEVGPNTITVTVTAEDGTTTGTYTVVVTRVRDTDAPQLLHATILNGVVTLSYDEDLDDDGVRGRLSVPAAVDDFTVSAIHAGTGIAYEPRVNNVSFYGGRDVYLYLEEAVYFADTVTVDYTPGDDPKILDGAGNAAAGMQGHPLVNLTPASGDVWLRSLELSGIKMPSRISPFMTASVEDSVSTTTVTATTSYPSWGASAQVRPDDADSATPGHQVRLRLGSNKIRVTVTAEDGSTGTYTVTVIVSNEDAPLLRAATVDEDEVELSYAEALDGDSVPFEGNFTVSVTDSATAAVSARTVTGVSINGRAVSLTLSEAVRHGDVVTIRYQPGTRPIQSAADGEAADGLFGHTLTNNTAIATDSTLRSLAQSVGNRPALHIDPARVLNPPVYKTTVASDRKSVTVTAVPDDPRASVEITPLDGDRATPGSQIALNPGLNTITVTVTAENGSTTTYTYTIDRPRPPETVNSDAVTSIDWDGFDAGTPTHHNADLAKAWLLTALKWTLNNWWDEFKNFDDQSDDTYLDFTEANNSDGGQEKQIRESSSMALALAVALRTGIYDAGVTGMSEATARARALKLIRSLAYRHRVNAPASSPWGYHWQSALWTAHAGFAAWMLWDHLSAQDKAYVKKMVVAEADEYRGPLYFRDREGTTRFPGDSKAEEQSWNSYVLSLAAVMMPDHVNAPTWRTSSIHMMLAANARPEDVSNSTVYHGHPLSDWLEGSNTESDSGVINHGFMHPDYVASGTVFNPALMYFLADRPTPQAARHNIDRVMAFLVETNFEPGSRPYYNQQTVKKPGGTIFKPGTNCSGLFSDDPVVRSDAQLCRASSVDAMQTFAPGHTRACAQGPPATAANVFYPFGSDWSTKRRPNMAGFVAQAEVFDFSNEIDDSTLHADYWFACYARDVRAMQARHSAGNTWVDSDGLGYEGREGQSAHYAAKAWLAYWIQHQNGEASIAYENDPQPLEFNRIATYEAEDGDNTLSGSAEKVSCSQCSAKSMVKLSSTGEANALTISDIDAPTAGLYILYIIYKSKRDREIRLTVAGKERQYEVSLPGLGGLGVAFANVYLDAGDNDLIIEKLSHKGSEMPSIDRVVLGGGSIQGLDSTVDVYLPVASSASVNGSSLVLSYYEALDPAWRPPVGDFPVSVTDSETGTVSTRRVTGVAVAGSEVTLTLSAAVKFGDTVTLDYTPGTNQIRDVAGNAGTSLDDFRVTNNTPAE